MIEVLKNRVYAALFSAQVIALLGTGLLTIALGLLAYELAGDQAGAVLGTAYAIKMVAYVGLAPIAGALAERLPRKAVLIGADLLRAGVALLLPFIDAVWQIYALIFVLQAASATFTPAFQATIPEVLPDEKDYTNALSMSRLAYELENLFSPILAGLLLMVITFHWLFLGTVAGFLASAVLVFFAAVPPMRKAEVARPFAVRLTRGSRIYLSTPRLRGLLSLNLTAAAVSAFILVNTVVVVRSGFGGSEIALAYAMGAFGLGSVLAALALPRLLERWTDRSIMIVGATAITLLTLVGAAYYAAAGLPGWWVFLTVWAAMGLLYAGIVTPSGRLLRRSAHAEDRPAVFTAQFALSHACWLVTYPVAGWAGSAFGLPVAMALLGGLALIGVIFALTLWPADGKRVIPHEHPDLPPDHPHLRKHAGKDHRHRHIFVIDDEHRVWPTHG